MKEKIIEILLNTLSYAYCDNCGQEGEECEWCHRKYQNWKLGRQTAEKMTDKIIDTINACGNVNPIFKEELDEI